MATHCFLMYTLLDGVVMFFCPTAFTELSRRVIIVGDLPASVTESDIQAAFPGASVTIPVTADLECTGFACLEFPSMKAMFEAAKDKRHVTLGGVTCRLTDTLPHCERPLRDAVVTDFVIRMADARLKLAQNWPNMTVLQRMAAYRLIRRTDARLKMDTDLRVEYCMDTPGRWRRELDENLAQKKESLDDEQQIILTRNVQQLHQLISLPVGEATVLKKPRKRKKKQSSAAMNKDEDPKRVRRDSTNTANQGSAGNKGGGGGGQTGSPQGVKKAEINQSGAKGGGSATTAAKKPNQPSTPGGDRPRGIRNRGRKNRYANPQQQQQQQRQQQLQQQRLRQQQRNNRMQGGSQPSRSSQPPYGSSLRGSQPPRSPIQRSSPRGQSQEQYQRSNNRRFEEEYGQSRRSLPRPGYESHADQWYGDDSSRGDVYRRPVSRIAEPGPLQSPAINLLVGLSQLLTSKKKNPSEVESPAARSRPPTSTYPSAGASDLGGRGRLLQDSYGSSRLTTYPDSRQSGNRSGYQDVGTGGYASGQSRYQDVDTGGYASGLSGYQDVGTGGYAGSGRSSSLNNDYRSGYQGSSQGGYQSGYLGKGSSLDDRQSSYLSGYSSSSLGYKRNTTSYPDDDPYRGGEYGGTGYR